MAHVSLPVNLQLTVPASGRPEAARRVNQSLAEANRSLAALPAQQAEQERRITGLEAQQDLVRKLTFGLIKPFKTRIQNAKVELHRLTHTAPYAIMRLHLQLAEEIEESWDDMGEAFAHLGGAERIWRIDNELGTIGKLMDLSPCKLAIVPPTGLNLKPFPYTFNTVKAYLALTPLGAFWRREGTDLHFVPWGEVKVTFHEEPFRERAEKVPEDAQVIFETWEFVTSEGKPDPNLPPESNPRLSVVRYGKLGFELGTQTRFDFLVSEISLARHFGEAAIRYFGK